MSVRIRPGVLNSIRVKLLIVVLAFLLPFIMLLVYIDFYAIAVIRGQVADSNQNVIDLHLKQLDSSLKDMDQYLADLSVTDNDIMYLETGKDTNQHILALVRLKNKISKDIVTNEFTDAIFIYSIPKQVFIMSKNVNAGTALTMDPKKEMMDYLHSTYQTYSKVSEGWQVQQIQGEYYLFRVIKKSDTFVGAWVKADRLVQMIGNGNRDTSETSVFVTNQGLPMNEPDYIRNHQIDLKQNYEQYYLTGSEEKYLVVGKHSTMGNFGLVAISPDSQLLQGFPYVRNVVFVSAGTALILIPLYLLFLRRTVLVPMYRILSVMKRIRKGRMEERIERFNTSEEFQVLYETFNEMVSQIQDLKIDIYEEKIHRQKAELEHLQLQVKPHFFLNTLNIMNSLARSRSYELLQEMSLCLIQYFRYMFRSKQDFVSLKDELHHVRNYVRIQELRFPESLRTDFDVSDFLLQTPVPPLLIHTFVENTIKHSVTLDEPIQLSISAHLSETHPDSDMHLVIRDTGSGFSEQALSLIEAGEPIIDEYGGEHIGIQNVKRRLALQYGDKAVFTCYNDPSGGAVVDIRLPLNPNPQA